MRLLLSLYGAALFLKGALATPPHTPHGESPDEDGKYWIYGEGIAAAFIPYGASITNLIIDDKNGIPRDLVMGFDKASDYPKDKSHPHLGGVPGRYANRIKNSTFEIDGKTYRVTANENPTRKHPDGLDTLHGGVEGWDWRDFDVVSHTDESITFSIVDPDGKEGFPGEVISYITYTMGNLTWDAKMVAIATTKKTPIMLSSHTYWNLDGFANDETDTIFDHTLHLPYSGQRIDVDNILIPTGKILPNPEGSVNDFWSAPKQIGDGFKDPEIHGNCGFDCTGYDNCWLVNRPGPHDWRADGAYVASLYSAWSGIRLDIYSDQDAFQMYSCNGQDGTFPLKSTQGVDGRNADKRHPHKPAQTVPQYGCVVLEVEDYIDGINHPEWGRLGKQVFGPGSDPYVLQISHRFSVDTDDA
ncbi:aldose epimerase-like protein [Thermothelomyces thermophilus ATCC 42464]|uniref:Aldose epimerase-like protein n=1 Tax=Thermothelomyces thermophilus (strain ATCC 42464 / BCRC 31852 / DSM 1799) TaxID=573729 RepID=G2QQ55_THET4|nr:aldose epimerase-like protein [Thermothelomyces thermophilus ATCC 42464]AEO61718.1 aldose epimerase-like protein [Thermothelomyces thermophilus ATCC 42464]